MVHTVSISHFNDIQKITEYIITRAFQYINELYN
jgi:hypothetical protein